MLSDWCILHTNGLPNNYGKLDNVSLPLPLFADLSVANNMFFVSWCGASNTIDKQWEWSPHGAECYIPSTLQGVYLKTVYFMWIFAVTPVQFYIIISFCDYYFVLLRYTMQWVYFYSTMRSINVCLQSGNNLCLGDLSSVAFFVLP